ncbi:transposable element Tcb2 transposase [Trichonephila clavipes]|nr:transposable element Tcb2 transposase [Trichonephila clavipes]
MIWGAIAYNTWSPLVLILSTMTAQWYVHDILQPHVLPLMRRLPGAIFQQDNAQPHTARHHLHTRLSPRRYYSSLDCPIPPDLSPIDPIWYHLGQASHIRYAQALQRSRNGNLEQFPQLKLG